ncbi:sarcosine oxidase subunit gamma [Kitasatospora atroaurantiaca]|uniref:Sarcosine oxidase subunit gamma n=1 Tax=Kitasatospora atroaurantiaca TaxID=285545 RepID=A0A561EI32_9ACTN|nr:sarcosine oxidase subunit gamma family protein [Kitasatospora atroaurantiaca]TWE15275.1 sarcosine oxidase subunit gamma [Kitasatospora atroaurantiaca]
MTVDGLRRSPLGHLASQTPTRDVRLREIPFLTQLNLRLSPGSEAAARVAEALGAALPTEPNTVSVTESGDLRLLWLSPDEWLVVGPDGCAPQTEGHIRTALQGEHASLVDVSANRTTLELSGPGARTVLETGCALDLHPRTFVPGRCAQTLVSKVNVVLDQVDAEPRYRLLVRGSFAQYLADWLLDAMSRTNPTH